MNHIKNTYTLIPLSGPSILLTEALKVYARNIAPSIKTATNDIEYWASKYNTAFNDTLFMFALAKNDDIIGFSQMVFFVKEELLVIDYMAIENQHRRYNAFFEFKEQIQAFLDEKNVQCKFVIAEIPFFSNSRVPSETSRKLIRLLKLAGFGVLKARYYQPQLGTSNPESVMPSTLMILRNDPSDTMKKETYLSIVNAIYYKHYARWYKPLPNIDYDQYKIHIDKLWNEINEETKFKTVEINGAFEIGDQTCRRFKRPPYGLDIARFSMFCVVLTIVIFLILSGSQSLFHLSTISIVLFALLAILVLAAILSLFFPRALLVFKKTISAIFNLFGTKE